MQRVSHGVHCIHHEGHQSFLHVLGSLLWDDFFPCEEDESNICGPGEWKLVCVFCPCVWKACRARNFFTISWFHKTNDHRPGKWNSTNLRSFQTAARSETNAIQEDLGHLTASFRFTSIVGIIQQCREREDCSGQSIDSWSRRYQTSCTYRCIVPSGVLKSRCSLLDSSYIGSVFPRTRETKDSWCCLLESASWSKCQSLKKGKGTWDTYDKATSANMTSLANLPCLALSHVPVPWPAIDKLFREETPKVLFQFFQHWAAGVIGGTFIVWNWSSWHLFCSRSNSHVDKNIWFHCEWAQTRSERMLTPTRKSDHCLLSNAMYLWGQFSAAGWWRRLPPPTPGAPPGRASRPNCHSLTSKNAPSNPSTSPSPEPVWKEQTLASGLRSHQSTKVQRRLFLCPEMPFDNKTSKTETFFYWVYSMLLSGLCCHGTFCCQFLCGSFLKITKHEWRNSFIFLFSEGFFQDTQGSSHNMGVASFSESSSQDCTAPHQGESCFFWSLLA